MTATIETGTSPHTELQALASTRRTVDELPPRPRRSSRLAIPSIGYSRPIERVSADPYPLAPGPVSPHESAYIPANRVPYLGRESTKVSPESGPPDQNQLVRRKATNVGYAVPRFANPAGRHRHLREEVV